MEESNFQKDIMAIQCWLDRDCYKVVKRSHPYNIVCINALKEYSSNFFDLEIQYDYEKRSILLTIIYLGEIESEKYSFCLELLNYLNTHYSFSNYFLNPETVRLSCSKVFASVDYLGPCDGLSNALEAHTLKFTKQLSKIIDILKEDITLMEAVQRTIENVPRVNILLGRKAKPLKDLI
jgi:hypothetical protein